MHRRRRGSAPPCPARPRAPARRPDAQAATPASAAPRVAVSSRTTLAPRAGSKSTRITRSRPSRTCSMCVIRMTWGKRSARRRSRPTTCRRRASSSEPKISSSTSNDSGWPARPRAGGWRPPGASGPPPRAPARPPRAGVVALLPRRGRGAGDARGGARLGAPPPPPLAGRELLLGPLRLLHEALGAPGALLQRRGLERDRLELGELGPDRVVSRRVVARRACGETALELARPPPGAGELRACAIARLDLRPQLTRPGAGPAALLEDAVPLGFRIQQIAGPRSQLLESLPEVLPVPGDHLELRVEQGENARVFRPRRALAGGT